MIVLWNMQEVNKEPNFSRLDSRGIYYNVRVEYDGDVWHLGSGLLTPSDETPSSAKQGVGSDDTNFLARKHKVNQHRWRLGGRWGL